MIKRRPADERGMTQTHWLESYHTFSFNRYYDPQHTGFRQLLVINEDFVAPSQGFGTHSHRDMEIITYIVSGALQHRDSMGTSSVIRPGEVQRMSAGTGVSHSEFNPSSDEPTHLLQIWIQPERRDLTPGYEQRAFPAEERQGKLRLVASRDGGEGSVTVQQDVRLYDALLDAGAEVSHPLDAGRHAWLQVVKGTLTLNGTRLGAGDGAAASGEETLNISVAEAAEILLFDLA
ncbi:MAG TPA: pirin family protein [Pyrinomonadaceae bacterium]|jgi:redox-sensitive bicupin YhaK (pirin superfamily)|nr:pirin family protein [Pyrinomonadaceae bacterium]